MQQGFKNSEDSQETSEERLKRINEAIETIREKYSTSHNNNEKIQNEVEKTKQENKIEEIKIEQEKESKKSLKPFIFIGLAIVISLISIIVYKNNFEVKKEYSQNHKVIGEPTEKAIVEKALEIGINKRTTEEQMQRIAEIPFDSIRKMMTTIHKKGNKYIVITKGAPDILIERCEITNKAEIRNVDINYG